ncbi:MAG: lipid-A-disaccharide synthase [Candidatus Korobacteraceae bacterium]
MRIFLSAGEASGDMYGAWLIDALRDELRQRGEGEAEFFGVGGDAMRKAGCDIAVSAHEIAVVGLAEVVRHLPKIYRLFNQVVREIDRRPPDIAVLIDFPDFNLRLARQLHKRGVPVVYYVSPQLWAWRPSRVEQIRRYVSKMLVIFPFEQKFYAKHGINAEFVGHPLADAIASCASREAFAAQYGLDPARTWMALLPGSRQGEVSRIFPTLLEAAQLLGPDYVYIVPVASTLSESWMKSFLPCDSAIQVVFTGDAAATLAHARVAAVASGTSTLQAALIGTPLVMVYRVAELSWKFGRQLVKVDRFAMPNLIAERDVVPELVQGQLTAESVASELRHLIPEGNERSAMIEGFRDIRHRLSAGTSNLRASRRAAQAVLDALDVPA